MYGSTRSGDVHETITGMAGVIELGDKAGTVEVAREDGSSMVDVTVTDALGSTATVYLDRDAATRLILALAVASREL